MPVSTGKFDAQTDIVGQLPDDLADCFKDLGIGSGAAPSYETTGVVQALANKLQYNLGTSIATLTGALAVTSGGTFGGTSSNGVRSVDSSTEVSIYANNSAGANYIRTSTGKPLLFEEGSTELGRFNSGGGFSISGSIKAIHPTYADNASAISGGLTTNDYYKTATGELRVVV